MKLKTACLFLMAAIPTVAQEAFVLPVGPMGVEPMSFELRDNGAVRSAEGVSYRGDAALVTPLGRMVLAQSELWFGYAPGTRNVQTVRGKAFVPTPLSGTEASIDEPVMAEVGYDLGENIKDLGVPLIDRRGYLFFKFDTGLTMHVGKPPSEDLEEEEDTSFTLSFPAGASARMVVDPLDPMFYFAGGVTIPNKRKPEQEEPADKNDGEADEEEDGIVQGSGSSVQGLFPFRPLVTWGIQDQAREFMGHRIQTGTFPLFGLPVTVRGHVITNLDPLATGELAVDPFGIGFGPAIQAGANGRFAFSVDFLNVIGLGNLLNVTIPLGKATAAVEIVNDRQTAYISGIVDPATEFNMGLLLAQDGELKAAALASTDLEQSRLLMDGRYRIGASEFGKLLGIDVGDVLRVEGRLRADRTGQFLFGKTEAGLYMGPLTSAGSVAVEMDIPSNDPAKQYLQVSGLMKFAGMGTEGVGRVMPSGIAVAGKLTAPEFDMSMTGGVTVPQDGAAPFAHGSLTVPQALQPDLHGEIRHLAREVQADLDSKLTRYEEATKNFEFELSLRGMRTVVPAVVDTILREIDRQIPANINSRWPRLRTPFGSIEAPGKGEALRIANAQADPHRQRLRNLKQQMQSSDSAAVRSALQAAINGVLDNPRILVRYRVPVVGSTITIIDHTYVDASLRGRLNSALAGVRALPEASSRKVSAEEIWKQVPKREILRQTADGIEKGIAAAIPRIESIGFQFPLGRPEWEYIATVTLQGKSSTVRVRLSPDSIGSLGKAIGQVFAQIL